MKQMYKRLLFLVVGIALCVGMVACGGDNSGGSSSGSYTPGSYTASAEGYGGDVTVTMTFDANGVTDVTIDAPDETPTVGGAAAETLQDTVLEANGGDFDGVSGASFTSAAVQEAVASCIEQAKSSGGSYTPGSYTASAEGYGGDVTVTMIFDANGVTDVTIDAPDETPTVGGAAAETLQDTVLEANGGDFDGVSGASFTSAAVQEAVASCIEQATGG